MGSVENMPTLDDRAYQAELDRRLPMIRQSDIVLDLEDDYIVEGVLLRGALGVLYGPPGVGKSFFALDMAFHIAAGKTWRGLTVERSPVIYVACESGRTALRRFEAWKRENEMGDDAELHIIPVVVDMLHDNSVDALIERITLVDEIASCRGVVVIDTLSRSIPGANENAPEVMTKFVGSCDRIRDETKWAQLPVAHTGKEQSRGIRGHSSLHGATDHEIEFSEDRIATVVKNRDGEEGMQYQFRLKVVELGTDSKGKVKKTCVIEHLDDVARLKTLQRKQPSKTGQIALRALELMAGVDGLPQSTVWPDGARGCSIELWRNEYYKTSGLDATQQRVYFNRAKEDLLAKGWIKIFEGWVWLE